jgi:hypothetical protein
MERPITPIKEQRRVSSAVRIMIKRPDDFNRQLPIPQHTNADSPRRVTANTSLRDNLNKDAIRVGRPSPLGYLQIF